MNQLSPLPDFGSPDEWFRALAIIEDDDTFRVVIRGHALILVVLDPLV
jgi:hypothetical protein